jgi:hypothetical protein
MNGTIADPHNPRLGIWQTLIKLMGGSHCIVCQLEGSSFDVVRAALPIGKSLQSCRDFLLRLAGVPETRKSHHHGGQILLCCSGVVELS